MAKLILTEKAIKEVHNIAKEQELDASKAYLRMGVKGGGCAGFSYSLDLTEEFVEDKDELIVQDGINIICDQRSLIYIEGTTLDFKDSIMGRGFVFIPPEGSNTHQCGCGSSFSA